MRFLRSMFISMFAMIAAAAVCSGCSSQSSAPAVTEAPSESVTVPGESETTQAAAEPDESEAANEPVIILVAAAASLEYSYVQELIPMFQETYSWITVEGTYDSSGKLQTQIEEGLDADVFMSAAVKQMNALKDEDLIDADSIIDLLENKIVVILPEGSELGIDSFERILEADVIAVGDPESVPAGQYAMEAFTSLGIWNEVKAKSSLGTNVTEVLKWVSEGSADAGVVYATDAATTERVTVAAEAPDGSLAAKVIYPVGITTTTSHPEEARLWVEFLASDEALAVFRDYGFSPNK